MEKVDGTLGNLFTKISLINSNVDDIRQVANNQTNAMKEASIGINGIESLNTENAALAESLTHLATRLTQQTGNMRDSMEVFKIQTGFSHPKHELAFELANSTAQSIAKSFEHAIAQNVITQAALFDRNYRAIENTEPKKYKTKFDAFCDKTLPAIQETNLNKADFATYLIATDTNGYVPTHNQ